MAGLKIEKVLPDSIAEEMEIEPGDRLLAINGQKIRDIIDYNYLSADNEFVLEIAKPDGELWEVEVEKEDDESLGIIFPPPRPIRCGNKCIFCFVHQLPRGLRRPLYVQDEDYRLSFLYGNYVTLANISSSDLKRIKQQRLSPLYVSVHATDPLLRAELIGKGNILPILEVMGELADAGVVMHTQIVLCPEKNDGSSFEKTVADLAALYPRVASVAVVPVGLTKHREGLPVLQPVTQEYARQFVQLWQPRARKLAEKCGGPFLFIADEFYIKAGLAFPPLSDYGDLPQLENGVGMIPLFQEEANEVLSAAERLAPFSAGVVTGVSPFPHVSEFLTALARKTGVSLNPIAIENELFGKSVTVTGLLAGKDVLAGLIGKDTGDVVFVPDVMLKEGEGIFLDDLSVEDLQDELQKEVVVFEASPWGIYNAIVERSGGR